MIEDSQVPVLLTQQKLLEGFQSTGRMWPGHRLGDTKHCQENPKTGVTAENLAYTLYTSGSTGQPKGVQIAHRAVVNFLNSMRQEPD